MTGWIVGVVALAVISAAAMVVLGMRTPSIAVSVRGLEIRNSLFGRTIPLADLDLGAARVVDRGGAPELAPKWRTWGIGLPGHLTGWFRLRNGEKALLFLGPSPRIAYIPTRRGYVILVNPVDPEGLLVRLRDPGV